VAENSGKRLELYCRLADECMTLYGRPIPFRAAAHSGLQAPHFWTIANSKKCRLAKRLSCARVEAPVLSVEKPPAGAGGSRSYDGIQLTG
jgi:hypothetical protein